MTEPLKGRFNNKTTKSMPKKTTTTTLPKFAPPKTSTKKTAVAKLVIPKTDVANIGETIETLLKDCEAKGISPTFGRGTITLY